MTVPSFDYDTQRTIGSLVARVDGLESTMEKLLNKQDEILAALNIAAGKERTVASGWASLKWGVGVLCGSAATTLYGWLGGHIKWG